MLAALHSDRSTYAGVFVFLGKTTSPKVGTPSFSNGSSDHRAGVSHFCKAPPPIAASLPRNAQGLGQPGIRPIAVLCSLKESRLGEELVLPAAPYCKKGRNAALRRAVTLLWVAQGTGAEEQGARGSGGGPQDARKGKVAMGLTPNNPSFLMLPTA